MSAIGTKRTFLFTPHMSAFGGKADMACALHMSAFDPKRTSGTNFQATSSPDLRWRSSQQFVQHKPKSIA